MIEPRYCSKCGRPLRPTTVDRYPDYEWAKCPMYSIWRMMLGERGHDLRIVGDVRPRYDTRTGEALTDA